MWQVFFVNTPHGADIGAVFRVFNIATAGQLRGFLAHFTPTLSIALSRQCAVASTRTSEVAGCESKINGGDAVINAFALVFQTPRLIEQSSIGLPVHFG